MTGENHAGWSRRRPVLEWIVAGISLVITLALLTYVGIEALRAPEEVPPTIVAERGRITPFEGGWVVRFTARNTSPQAAASVEIEGTLRRSGQEIGKAGSTLDYIPAGSTREGGLFFEQDPRVGIIDVRPLGYAIP